MKVKVKVKIEHWQRNLPVNDEPVQRKCRRRTNSFYQREREREKFLVKFKFNQIFCFKFKRFKNNVKER